MTRVNNVVYLTIDDFETIVNQLREAQEEFSEDMPPFDTRYAERLESIVNQIQGNYFGVELYPSLEEKAARLFYLINKNHPFLNGNKRIAVMALFVFLSLNREELYFDEETINNELFEIATITAASLPEQVDEIIEMLITKSHQYINF